jgi:hypothetical protein
VELSFVGPDKRPSVAVLGSTGGEEFVDAVKDHVDKFRVPCLTPTEGPSAARFEFVFKPEDRKVFWAPPTDPTEKPLRRFNAFAMSAVQQAHLPRQARQEEQQGRCWPSDVPRLPTRPGSPVLRAGRPSAEAEVEDWSKVCACRHRGGPVEQPASTSSD